VTVHALVEVAQAGASVALLWGPQAREGRRAAALFSDTSLADGGRPLPVAALLDLVGEQLRRDPRLVRTHWNPLTQVWTLTTPEWMVAWSPATGMRGTSVRARG
jgi:hypothetical protein